MFLSRKRRPCKEGLGTTDLDHTNLNRDRFGRFFFYIRMQPGPELLDSLINRHTIALA